MGDHGGQKRVWDPLELELYKVISHLIGKLGMNWSPLQEQQVLPTAEPFQPQSGCFN